TVDGLTTGDDPIAIHTPVPSPILLVPPATATVLPVPPATATVATAATAIAVPAATAAVMVARRLCRCRAALSASPVGIGADAVNLSVPARSSAASSVLMA